MDENANTKESEVQSVAPKTNTTLTFCLVKSLLQMEWHGQACIVFGGLHVVQWHDSIATRAGFLFLVNSSLQWTQTSAWLKKNDVSVIQKNLCETQSGTIVRHCPKTEAVPVIQKEHEEQEQTKWKQGDSKHHFIQMKTCGCKGTNQKHRLICGNQNRSQQMRGGPIDNWGHGMRSCGVDVRHCSQVFECGARPSLHAEEAVVQGQHKEVSPNRMTIFLIEKRTWSRWHMQQWCSCTPALSGGRWVKGVMQKVLLGSVSFHRIQPSHNCKNHWVICSAGRGVGRATTKSSMMADISVSHSIVIQLDSDLLVDLG